MRPQQLTLGSVEFESHRKATRRSIFLSEMDREVPCYRAGGYGLAALCRW